MKLRDAIEAADAARENAWTSEEKTAWISSLDGILSLELFKTERSPYVWPDCDDVELLVPPPYDHDVYVLYLLARFDMMNREVDVYNNSAQAYNNAIDAYKRYYRRCNTPAPAYITGLNI